MSTHHAYIPNVIAGEPNTTSTWRSCKMSDPADPESLNRDEVDCPKCLDSLRHGDEGAWRTAECERLLADLEGTGCVEGQDEGYGVWHVRAGSLCMAVSESLHSSMLPRVPISWYLKITPIPERFNNHGYFVAVNYGLDGDVVHAAHEEWLPFAADIWHLRSVADRAQRTISKAIMFGVRQVVEGKVVAKVK